MWWRDYRLDHHLDTNQYFLVEKQHYLLQQKILLILLVDNSINQSIALLEPLYDIYAVWLCLVSVGFSLVKFFSRFKTSESVLINFDIQPSHFWNHEYKDNWQKMLLIGRLGVFEYQRSLKNLKVKINSEKSPEPRIDITE